MRSHYFSICLSKLRLLIVGFCWMGCVSLQQSWANDYLVTIGGGYEPAGNQASLEANVLFFQQIVRDKLQGVTQHQVYFADGTDPAEDLQIVAPKKEAASPAIALLESAFALDRPALSYRNHEVPNVRGPIQPRSIKSGLDEIAERLQSGDRLIIYVTAHGSPGPGKEPMNTAITCWKKESLSMKKFSEWLDRLPSGVPVVLVMAQCYCGGFANAMFAGGDPNNGLSKAVRAGFFAQRFDLPAAGCRPDVENDEEYSSYFWGAFLGRSRTGKAAEGVDCNSDGRISMEEAHEFAVRASQTIDIPLRSSDMFLRYYSRIAGYDQTRIKGSPIEEKSMDETIELASFSGKLEEIAASAPKAQETTIRAVSKLLELPMDCELAEVVRQYQAQDELFRQSRFVPGRRGGGPGGPGAQGGPQGVGGPGRRGPRNSSRREFQRQIIESWPDLEKPSDWKEIAWLHGNEGEELLEELRRLPGYEAFKKNQEDRRASQEKSSGAEHRDVLFRRLIHTLESVVLARNLPRVATPDVLNRYQAMLELESSILVKK